MNYLKREAERKFLKMSSNFKAVLVTGARQVGKSTMLKHLAENSNRRFVSMDSVRDRELAENDPDLFFQTYRPPLLIDEIQKAPALFEKIKMICDDSDERSMFWLTGSQSKRLLKEANESLAGRMGILRMYGYSQREIRKTDMQVKLGYSFEELENRSVLIDENNINSVFSGIWRGGMPDAAGLDEESLGDFFDSYIESYLMRDAVDDEKISDTNKFRKFLLSCATINAQLVNFSTLADAAEISIPTAKEWLASLERMGIIYLLRPYSDNELKRIVKTPKLYFCDTGLCAHLSRWTSFESLMNGASNGVFFENYVVMEFVKYYSCSKERAELSFYSDQNGKEIDLVIEKEGVIHPIEIKLGTLPDKRNIKKFDVFDRTAVKRSRGGIVCMCQKPFPIDENNNYIPCSLI